MKKRILSLFIILCLLLSVLPTAVFAATEYDLYINEFQFTSTNLTYTGEVGSAVYSPQTKTLSLNSLTISTSRTNALIYSNIPGLTINVNGTTTINLLDSNPIGGSDIGQEQTNHALMFEADTTVKGQSGNKSRDKLVINSKSIGVTNPEPNGTTRVGISSFSQLTLQDITLSMTDNSVTNKVGYASLIRAGGQTSISGCTLDAQKCAHGVFMLEKAAANIAGTEFSMNLNGTLTSGLNFSSGTTNLVSNCSGTINATYPLYSQGSVTVNNAAGGKLTLNGTRAAAIAAENKGAAGGKLLFQDANVVLTSSDSYGIHLQPNASAELKRSTVDVTAPNICVYVDENAKLSLTDGSDRTCRLYLKGTNTAEGGSVGIYAKGSASFDAGLLSISNVYTAIQNMHTGTVDFSGGSHTLNATTCGYLNNGTGKLKIGGNVNVTVNALIGIQLTKNTGGTLEMTGGTLNLNCGETGLRLQNGAGKTTLSGGRLNITGTGSTPTADGITAYSAIEFSGTEVFFQRCKRDLISLNGANKLTAGKLSLSGSSMGAQLSGGFEMTGGELVSDCAGLGVVVTNGTAALKNGTLTLNAGYPLYLQRGGVLNFAGAEVRATATENCALYVDPNTANGASSYRITGGTVVLQSTQAAANAVYTSLPENYGVWVGADEASAAPVSNVTQPVLARNKYARFAERQSYTLTLVNVKEGTSATVVGGDAITYTAKDAPAGQHFSRWELTVGTNTTNVGTNATYTGTMPHSDATLTAVYEACRGGTATCKERATCEVCGKPYGSLAPHSYTAEVAEAKYLKSEADCGHAAVYYKSCTGCGESSKGTESEATFTHGEPLGHDWGAWTSNGDGTHTRVCAHDAAHTETKNCHGGTADCTHKPVCEDCGAEYGTGTNHDFTAEIVGEKYLRSEADCDHAAVYYKSCTRCGESSEGTEQEATFERGAPLGHIPVTDPETELLTQGEHCSVCGAVLTAQQPKLTSFWTDEGNYDAALYASEPGNWVIYDAADLAALAKKVESGSTFKGCTVTLAADIDLSGHLWIPIGYLAHTASGPIHLVFEGTFDGGLHKITGMFACPQGYSRSIAEVGLFGYVNEGTVRDLLLFGTVSYSSAVGGSNAVGGLVGYLNMGTLQNCGFVGSVYLYSGNAFSHNAGGLTGYAWSSRIENCYAIASVEASVPRSTISVGGVGGGATGWSGPLTVRNCYLAVKLRATAVENTRAYIGGLAPMNYLSGEGHTVENNFVQHGFAVKGHVHESALNGTLLRKSAMQSDTLLTALNDYISRNPGSGMRAWTLDPAQNGGYPSFGVSVWFVSNLTGVENGFSALPVGGKVEAYAPTATGYDLVGWYTDEALTEAFDFTQPVTEDTVLYAKWKLHVCTPGTCIVGENGLHDTLCTVCGKRLDCAYTETVVDPTCTSAGYTVHTCTNCGSSYLDSVVEGGHKWGTTVIPPTHTEPGYTLYECSVCKESYKTDYTAPVGHAFDEGTVTKEATCTAEGEMTYACSCGATHTVPIPMTEHELTSVVTAPTCTELGYTTHSCKHCDYFYTDTPVGALGHAWDMGVVAAAPTLTATGKLIQTCTVCHEQKETVLPMLTLCEGGEGCPSSAYVDVPESTHWAHVGIDFVLKSGLFYGTSDTTFEPDGEMTRAMLVTVLYRLEGQPKPTTENPFGDVAAGTWYTDAVIWAAENKIVNGIGGDLFDPDGSVTREQMAAILYRYSVFKGLTMAQGAFAMTYPDEAGISAYALEAMRWANAEKLINGTELDGTVYLDPQGSATRAQVAAILMRYVQNVLSNR
jgi:uncharacterized repeat protein (TIGR02543 family)